MKVTDNYYVLDEDFSLLYWHKDMFEPVENEKGFAENIGATIDKAINESPIVIKQYTELQKKYDDLKELNHTQELEIIRLRGQISAYEKILEIGGEE